MTQKSENSKKLAELSALFTSLDTKEQDLALTILRSLGFAESVMCSSKEIEKFRNQAEIPPLTP